MAKKAQIDEVDQAQDGIGEGVQIDGQGLEPVGDDLPPANEDATPEFVKMYRETESEGPSEANVHPDEVANYAAGGWSQE